MNMTESRRVAVACQSLGVDILRRIATDCDSKYQILHLIYLNNTQFGEIVRRFKAIGSRWASWVSPKSTENPKKIGPAFPGAIIEALVLPFLCFYVTTVIRPFQNFQYWPKSFETARSRCFITTYRLNFDQSRLFLLSVYVT